MTSKVQQLFEELKEANPSVKQAAEMYTAARQLREPMKINRTAEEFRVKLREAGVGEVMVARVHKHLSDQVTQASRTR